MRGAMSIALESGPGLGGGGGGGGGPRFGRVARCAYAASPPPASVGARSSSSVGRDSDSPAAAAKWEWDGEEVEGGDGEVQSSYKGPFDTMDALQEALPFRYGWLPLPAQFVVTPTDLDRSRGVLAFRLGDLGVMRGRNRCS